MRRVLVLAAHPDDEILGCGATMAKHIIAGDRVRVVIFAEGLTSRISEKISVEEKNSIQLSLENLRKTTRAANALLGVDDIHFEGLPDNRMDSWHLLDLAKIVEKHSELFQPDIVYTHFYSDLNIDHRMVCEAAMTAFRPQPKTSTREILFFEVASSTEWRSLPSASFVPNVFVNCADSIHLKFEALEIYEKEMRPWPHARSIKSLEALSKWRGASCGYDAAEAFYLFRLLR